jgi:GNAT superfamily N-acetyltransferase
VEASNLKCRLATEADVPAVLEIMNLAIERLQRDYLSGQQIAASHAVMGLDTQLIADRTYYIVEMEGSMVGCGGWSRRATLYGGDHSLELRDARFLDRIAEAARVRAMYTHPDFARRGVGRAVLYASEEAAAAEGFLQAELMATLAGEPLYRACGYRAIERTSAAVDGVTIPLVRMRKHLSTHSNSTIT